MDADDHGKRKRKNLFPGNIKAQFPSAWNTSDCFFEGEYSYDTKHTYPAGIMKKKNRVKIVQGKRLGKDVISLLSNGGKREYLVRNNGVRVPLLDSIAGKYLLFCCFAIPLASYRSDAELCRNMISAYSQLKAADCNFEMVIVARIASANMVVNDGDEEAAFNRFFDAFPCLAVPFSDSESRDLLCYSLGLTTVSPRSSSLLLDPDQLVLQTDAYCFNLFGAAAFPFTTHHLDALYRQDHEIKLRLDFIEREMKSSKEAITTPWIPVSLEELQGGGVNLRLFETKIASWWVMPLVDEAWRRLWRLCGHMREDNLVILTNDGWGDLEGRFVIDEIGIYPFTRKSVLDQYILYFRSSTAESLLNQLTSHY